MLAIPTNAWTANRGGPRLRLGLGGLLVQRGWRFRLSSAPQKCWRRRRPCLTISAVFSRRLSIPFVQRDSIIGFSFFFLITSPGENSGILDPSFFHKAPLQWIPKNLKI